MLRGGRLNEKEKGEHREECIPIIDDSAMSSFLKLRKLIISRQFLKLEPLISRKNDFLFSELELKGTWYYPSFSVSLRRQVLA